VVGKKVTGSLLGVIARPEGINATDKAYVSSVRCEFEMKSRILLSHRTDLIENCPWKKRIVDRA
jgi:hypothetical protein